MCGLQSVLCAVFSLGPRGLKEAHKTPAHKGPAGGHESPGEPTRAWPTRDQSLHNGPAHNGPGVPTRSWPMRAQGRRPTRAQGGPQGADQLGPRRAHKSLAHKSPGGSMRSRPMRAQGGAIRAWPSSPRERSGQLPMGRITDENIHMLSCSWSILSTFHSQITSRATNFRSRPLPNA